jgi:AcrR family transcriptional regulator
VTVKRAYDGSRRTAATRATQQAVVDGARRLFLEQGYPATTVAQIADESGVPQATLYRLFGSKRAILKALMDVAFGGDDEPTEFQHRPEVQAAFGADDPGKMLDAFAHLLRGVMHRAGALQHVLATSAVVDEEAAEMLHMVRRQRHTGQSRIVRELARRKVLPLGLTQAAAADIAYTVMSPEVYRILTVERGWSDDRYEAWLARTLRAQLLRGDGRQRRTARNRAER